MTRREFNVAVISFEYEHHVDAIKKTVDKFIDDGFILNVKLWCSRDGIRPYVDRMFPNVDFIVQHQIHAVEGYDLFELTDLEKEHFSYTQSRKKIFRNIHKIKEKESIYYQKLTSFCYSLLSNNEIDLIIFADIPHSAESLAFDYASKKTNSLKVYRDGPYFGNYNAPLIIDDSVSDVIQNDANFKGTVIEELKYRDMSSKYEKPHYIKNKNANITQIPQGEKPYFYLDVGEYIYSITKSILLAKAFIFAIRKTLSLLMPAYFYFVKKIYLKDSSLSVAQFKKKYILLLMQYHPERTTSNRAHDTPFDIKRIEVLSKLFPNHKIIVYEHFMNINNFRAFCYRPIDFFYRISNLANVTYLSPQNNDFYRQLVMNSLVTISTSGTHAIESPQVGVPSIHLSNSFARNLPGVITLTDLSDLSLDMINSEIEYLKSLSKGEYIDLVLDVLNQRPFNEGFIAGYHNEKYDKSKYIHDAHMIIYNHLKYCLSNDYSK